MYLPGIPAVRTPSFSVPLDIGALSPCFPHLGSNRYETVEEFFAESNGSKLFLLPILIENQKTISDLAVCGPSNYELGFPSKTTDFLDFLRSS